MVLWLEAATSERKMVGACLTNSNARQEAFEIIKPDDCFQVRHANILKAIQELEKDSQPVDIAGVEYRLKAMGLLEESGGDLYLIQLYNEAKDQFTYFNLAEMVLEASARRAMMSVTDDIRALVMRQELPMTAVIAEVLTQVDKVSKRLDIHPPELIGSAASKFFDQFEALENAKGENRIYTGLDALDTPTMLGGFQPGDFILLGGDTGMGKTALAISISIYMARMGLLGLWNSMEMPVDQMVKRFASGISGVSLAKLRGYSETEKRRFAPMRQSIEMSAQERGAYVNAVGAIADLPIALKYMPVLTPADVWAEGRSIKRQAGRLDYIIVDIVTNMSPNDNTIKDGRHAELNAIGNALKSMAVNLETVVIGLSQLKSSVYRRDDKRPRQGEFAGSRNLGNEADVHMFIYRDSVYNPESDIHSAEVLVRKHRDGPVTTSNNRAEIYFDPTCAMFKNAKIRTVDMSYDKRTR